MSDQQRQVLANRGCRGALPGPVPAVQRGRPSRRGVQSAKSPAIVRGDAARETAQIGRAGQAAGRSSDRVEIRRFELPTSCMPCVGSTSTCVHLCRSPSWASPMVRLRPGRLQYFRAVCATRRWNVERGVRPFLLGRRSGLIEAGGSLIRGAPGRVGSSPDNAGTCWYCQTVRVRLARPVCVTRVNQWLKPRNECRLKSGG
jgi:hypothetical protein